MSRDVTQLLMDWNHGDEEALAQLMPLVYDELHRLAEHYMRRERSGHTLQPTALVNEAYLQLVDQNRVEWRNRAHFFGIAAQLMRRVTLLHARRLRAAKRGDGILRITFDESLIGSDDQAAALIDLDQALDDLAALEPQLVRIVELRFFGGLTVEESGEVLSISSRTVKRKWRMAKAWLIDRLHQNVTLEPGVPQLG